MAAKKKKPLMAWPDIQKLAEEGVPLIDISKLSGFTVGTIRTKSYNEDWQTPIRLAHQMREAGKKGPLAPMMESIVQDVEAVEVQKAVKNLDYGGKVAAGASHKVLKALASMPIPRTWKDLNTADVMVRRALGLDKQTTKVTSLFNPASGIHGIVHETTVGEIETDD